MAGRTPSGGLNELDYETVFTALASTVKGRRFLEAYLERNRPDEMRRLLEALARIESGLSVVRDTLQPRQIARELRRIASRLPRTGEARAARSELEALARALSTRKPASSQPK